MVVYSSHESSRVVIAGAAERGLCVFNATCPLVTKVHGGVAKMRSEGREIVMIGHAGYPEVDGTMGKTPSGMYLVETVADVKTVQVKTP